MIKISKELRKLVEYQNSMLNPLDQKLEIDTIITDIISNYEDGDFDFSSHFTISLKQGDKKRIIYQYPEWSVERFLCIYLKCCISETFKVIFPNRSEYITSLFGIMAGIQNMKDFVIVRFDFKDFFNTISSEYIFNKYITHSYIGRIKKDLIEKLITQCPYCYAGLNTSNVFAELIARDFDELLQVALIDRGLIFYRRYVDDGVLIFNRFISENEITDIIVNTIHKNFNDPNIHTSLPCMTALNSSSDKFTYIARRNILTNTDNFNFLGYNFEIGPKSGKLVNIKYGITSTKIQKYTDKIRKIIKDYAQNSDMELLRHRLRGFSKRIVYRNEGKWKSKGFVANYNELRFHLNYLDIETKIFLETGIINVFVEESIELPYFLKMNKEETPYCLYNNLKSNKALLFEEIIGIDKATLIKLCKQIGIVSNNSIDYNLLLKKYLIKIKFSY